MKRQDRQTEDTRTDGVSTAPAEDQDRLGDDVLELLRHAKDALQEVKPMLLNLDPGAVKKVRVHPKKAAHTALAAWPGIEPFRDKLVALPDTDVADLDLLPKLAQAVWCLEGMLSEEAQRDLRELAGRCFEHRTMLVESARPLARAGLMKSSQVDPLGTCRGYFDLAAELKTLANLYRGSWKAIGGRTLVTEADVDKSVDLGVQLFAAMVARKASPGAQEPNPQQLQARAVAALYACYRRLRKALNYLCESESEAAAIMPSLRALSRKSKRTEGGATAGGAGAEVPATPTAAAPVSSGASPPEATASEGAATRVAGPPGSPDGPSGPSNGAAGPSLATPG